MKTLHLLSLSLLSTAMIHCGGSKNSQPGSSDPMLASAEKGFAFPAANDPSLIAFEDLPKGNYGLQKATGTLGTGDGKMNALTTFAYDRKENKTTSTSCSANQKLSSAFAKGEIEGLQGQAIIPFEIEVSTTIKSNRTYLATGTVEGRSDGQCQFRPSFSNVSPSTESILAAFSMPGAKRTGPIAALEQEGLRIQVVFKRDADGTLILYFEGREDEYRAIWAFTYVSMSADAPSNAEIKPTMPVSPSTSSPESLGKDNAQSSFTSKSPEKSSIEELQQMSFLYLKSSTELFKGAERISDLKSGRYRLLKAFLTVIHLKSTSSALLELSPKNPGQWTAGDTWTTVSTKTSDPRPTESFEIPLVKNIPLVAEVSDSGLDFQTYSRLQAVIYGIAGYEIEKPENKTFSILLPQNDYIYLGRIENDQVEKVFASSPTSGDLYEQNFDLSEFNRGQPANSVTLRTLGAVKQVLDGKGLEVSYVTYNNHPDTKDHTELMTLVFTQE